MIKLFPKPLIAVLPVLCLVLLGGCDKDDAKTSDKIELLSFGPTGANHGDTLRFIGLNLDKVTAVHFTGPNAIVEKSAFKSQAKDMIKLLVPEAAEKGQVTLKTPQGDIVSKTQLNLGVMPTVSGMTSEARPAANITINGTYLNWVTKISFPKGKDVTSFVSQAFDKIVLAVPTAAETGPLVITYSGTDSGFYETEDTVKVTLPKGATVAPGILYHGENVTITGTDLDLVRKVYFTNVSAAVTTFVSQSATELVVKVPNTALKGPLKLEAESGVQTVTTGELDVKLPKATGIAPAAVKHLENVTITGVDMQLVKKIHFTNVTAPVSSFVSQSSTQIVVQVPGATKKGPVKLETEAGLQTTSTAEVDLILPAIVSFAPSPVDPNANVTITGTNLDLVTAVVLENVPPITNFESQSAAQLVFKVPADAWNGLITLKVLNSTVTVSSSTVLEVVGSVGPPIISKHFYNDAVTSNWNGWTGDGWGGTRDYANTTPVRFGTKSVKIVYNAGAWGSPLQLGGANVSLTGYTTIKFSIYSTPEAAGNKVKVTFNGKDDEAGYFHEVTLGPAGKWTDFIIPLSNFNKATNITELRFKENQGKAYTMYIDEIGLN